MDTSTNTRLIDTDPEHKKKPRGVELEWLVEEDTNDEGNPRRQLAVLTVMHHGRSEIWGRSEYCITASLSRQTETDRANFKVRGFFLFAGVNICSTGSGAVKRYSPKVIEKYTEVALDQLRERRDDEEVMRIFGEID